MSWVDSYAMGLLLNKHNYLLCGAKNNCFRNIKKTLRATFKLTVHCLFNLNAQLCSLIITKMSQIPTTQKLYRLHKFEGIDSLTLHNAEPVEQPKRKQVLVRLHAASLNFRDLLISSGRYGASFPSGLIPLSDAAGEVVQVGPEVNSLKIGDKVCGTFYEAWTDGEVSDENTRLALGGSVPGVLSQYRVFEESALVKFPSHLSWEEAATLPCAAVTAWFSLAENGIHNVGPGNTVLIIGTGGVSLFGLQFAVQAGATVIVLSSSDEKLEKAKKLGATHLVNYNTHPDWHVKVKELTNGKGVDHVLEVGGDGTLLRSLNSVKKGGHVHMIGVLARSEENVNVGLHVLLNVANLRGILVGSRGTFERMNRVIEQHAIKPIVDSVFKFEQAKEALQYLASGKHFGKIVIRID